MQITKYKKVFKHRLYRSKKGTRKTDFSDLSKFILNSDFVDFDQRYKIFLFRPCSSNCRSVEVEPSETKIL